MGGFALVKRTVLLGGAVAAILVASVVVGVFVLPLARTSATSTPTSSDTSTSTQATNPLPSFGDQTSTITIGASPYGIAYDPVSGGAFVAVSGAATVVILDDQSVVVGNVSLGGAADFLAYDPSNSLLYASLVGSNSIAIINTTLESVVSSVVVGAGPGWVAYDPASGTIYCVNREANTVSVISNASLVKTITLDGLPFALAYDPSDGDMYVTNNAGTVFVINGTSNSLIRSMQVGGASSTLLGIAYNPSDQLMYRRPHRHLLQSEPLRDVRGELGQRHRHRILERLLLDHLGRAGPKGSHLRPLSRGDSRHRLRGERAVDRRRLTEVLAFSSSAHVSLYLYAQSLRPRFQVELTGDSLNCTRLNDAISAGRMCTSGRASCS
jgi:YVTN family beta-propeller protein